MFYELTRLTQEIKLIYDTNENLVVLLLDGSMSKDYTVQEMRETLNTMLVYLDEFEEEWNELLELPCSWEEHKR